MPFDAVEVTDILLSEGGTAVHILTISQLQSGANMPTVNVNGKVLFVRHTIVLSDTLVDASVAYFCSSKSSDKGTDKRQVDDAKSSIITIPNNLSIALTVDAVQFEHERRGRSSEANYKSTGVFFSFNQDRCRRQTNVDRRLTI